MDFPSSQRPPRRRSGLIGTEALRCRIRSGRLSVGGGECFVWPTRWGGDSRPAIGTAIMPSCPHPSTHRQRSAHHPHSHTALTELIIPSSLASSLLLPLSSPIMSSSSSPLINSSAAWQKLQEHCRTDIPSLHLRDLLQDSSRYSRCTVEFDSIFYDFSRQKVTTKTLDLLFDLAKEAALSEKIASLKSGAHVNSSEDRAAMHIALRASAQDHYIVDGKNVVPDVRAVIDKISEFSNRVRSGEWKGATGQPLTAVVAIGIGGSYLGANFVYEALRTDKTAAKEATGRELRFLANVDPVGVTRALEGLNPATTLGIVISKTFTTRETMLNARTLRRWFTSALGESSIAHHMVACSTNLKDVKAFGINPDNAFEFWDWVGGRYSVTSAVGLLPLTLQYGPTVVDRFLQGCRSIDQHFLSAPVPQNLPILMGLLGVWNNNFLGYRSRALACYSEAMLKLAPHIQQVDMESNGKRVTVQGHVVDFATGEVNFGEPGTNSQHSFFQLFHQGQVVPVDFIGFVQSQQPIDDASEEVANHDELMANFFAQPDALATGKTEAELKAEGVDATVIPHRVMPGNRPSNVFLLPVLSAYEVGQLLALYEHRTVVEGFIWGINSFDQFGVELGKKLADKVRKQMVGSRKKGEEVKGFNPSTDALLAKFLGAKSSKL